MSTSIYLKIARTATGSVEDIKAPKAKLSYMVKAGDRGVMPAPQNIALEASIAIKVPIKEQKKMEPMFLKKAFLSMLKPDSKIIGGSSKSIKSLTK